MGKASRERWRRRMQLAEQRPDTNKAPRYQLVISLLPDGKVQVSGPLHKPEMCMEMLKSAGEVLISYQREIIAAQSPVIVAPNGIALVKGGG